MNILNVRGNAADNLKSKGGAFLMLALLACALVLIVLAVLPGHKALKAGTLAWVVLP